jgi:hypothetical protein
VRPERCWLLAVGVVRRTGTLRGGCGRGGEPELRQRCGVVLGRRAGLAGGVPTLVRCRVRSPAGRRLIAKPRPRLPIAAAAA